MAYATSADMIARFGEQEIIQLSNPDAPRATTVGEPVVTAALADAESEINSYIASRHSLPLAEVPRILLVLACDIARYRLYGPVSENDVVNTRYQDAIKFLKSISKGEATLGIAAPQQASAPTNGGAEFVAGRRRFTSETMEGFL